MARFLSEDWAREATAAAGASADLQEATKDVDLTMQQSVSGAPDGEATFFTRFRNGETTLGIGEAPDADIKITFDYETASEMDRGEVNAQAAFMQGRLKITGNMGKLLQNQDAVSALQQVLASLETEY